MKEDLREEAAVQQEEGMRSIEQILKRIDKINTERAQLKWKAYNLRAQKKPFREIVVQTVKLAEQQAKLKEELELRREERMD